MKNENAILADLKLKLHLDYPELEECYALGYEAASKERSEDENPFNLNSSEYSYWQEGWWAGFYEEEPIPQAQMYLSSTPLNQPEMIAEDDTVPANDGVYHHATHEWVMNVLKLTGIIAASAVVGYQVIELVA